MPAAQHKPIPTVPAQLDIEDAIAAVQALASMRDCPINRYSNGGILTYRRRPACPPAVRRPSPNLDRVVDWLNGPWPGKPLPPRPKICFIKADHPELGKSGDANTGNGHDPGEATPVTITFFQDRAAKKKREKSLTLTELADNIRMATAPAKDQLPWLTFARFGSNKKGKSLRHNANVLGIHGVVVDYDGEKMSLDEACKRLANAGILAIGYTTPSHSPEAPRWRICCPCFQELPPD